jgi:hypothetical protein
VARRKELTPEDVETLTASALSLFRMAFASADISSAPYVVVTGAHGKVVYHVEVYWTRDDWAIGKPAAVKLTGRR